MKNLKQSYSIKSVRKTSLPTPLRRRGECFPKLKSAKFCSPSIKIFLAVVFGLFYGKTKANNDEGESIERKKNITFSYTISAKDNILINNQFGDIKVTFWDKNEVKVEVVIVAIARTEELAARFINTVNVIGKKTEGQVSIKTDIDSNGGKSSNNSWSDNSGNNEKKSLKIDYQVFMPKENNLFLKNSFGNTVLPTFTSVLNITQSYGKLSAENISNTQSDVNLAFSKNSYIKSMTGGKLKASYSGIKMERADDLIFNNSFGDIDIKEVGKLNAKISYSNGLIGLIRESSNLKLEFSEGFKLGELGKNLKELNLNASYSPISLTLNDDVSYDFDVKSNYGEFSYPKERGVSFTKNTENEEKKQERYSFNPTKLFIGKVGKGATSCKIIINSNFGSVRLK